MIIVSMTTWRPRLDNVPKVVESIKVQTLRPDKVVINLSREEFDHNPLEQLEAEYYPLVKVNWTDRNTKVWKKLQPTFNLYPDAEIINIDDDTIYPPLFVERLHLMHKATNRPVTVNRGTYRHLFAHLGFGALIKAEYLRGIEPTDEVMRMVHASDLWYTFVVSVINKTLYASCPQAIEGYRMLPSPEPYTVTTDINPEWDWMERYYNIKHNY